MYLKQRNSIVTAFYVSNVEYYLNGPTMKGLILSADVATDGSFEVKNVSSRTDQAIVLTTCRGCSASKVASIGVNVVVADKDVADVRLQFIAQ